jgi:putative ABC transport system permease protein
MKAGVSLEAAAAEANTIGNALRPPRPATAPPLTGSRIQVNTMKSEMVGELQPALKVFLAAVVVVLLIVCANVANLLLARGTSRQREIAVRLAIGASRGRIAWQILTECVVLAIVGGLLGAALGAGGVALVKQLATVEAEGVWRLVFGATILPRAGEVTVSVRVLGIALGLAAITSVIFGILPALQLSRTNQLQAMGGRGSGRSRAEGRIRAALVVGQIVMATVLLVGAGLLVNSFINLSRVEKGYDPANVLTFQLVLPAEYATARKAETIETLLNRVRTLPGVRSAGFAYAGILIGIENVAGTWVPEGRGLDEFASDEVKPRLKALSGGYFDTMSMRVLSGRGIDGRDAPGSPLAVVLNRTAAHRLFGDRNPVGARMTWHGNNGTTAVTIAGIVEDVRQSSVDRAAYPEIFMDYRQVLAVTQGWGYSAVVQELLSIGFMSFGLKTTDDPRQLIPSVRQTISSVDANAGIDAITPMEVLVGNSVARQRFYAVLLGTFAAVAGVLAGIGIYGVLAYSVVQRTQEIGVRMALGAERRHVLAMILRRGAWLAAAGIVTGVGGAFAGARYLESMLYGIQPRDPGTFIAVAAAFASVAIIASYLPARRATRVDPMVALRVD